jgi:hypothetical protein
VKILIAALLFAINGNHLVLLSERVEKTTLSSYSLAKKAKVSSIENSFVSSINVYYCNAHIILIYNKIYYSIGLVDL